MERGLPVNVHVGREDDPVPDPPTNVVSVRSDITDAAAIAAIAQGCDVFVHLAGPASVSASFENPDFYCAAHVQGTVTVLEVCRKLGIPRFVYVSSAEIYGRSNAQPVSESQAYDPRSPYAAAKVGAEQLVRAYANAFGISARVLRPFSIYGPAQPPYAIVPTIVRQARYADRIALADLKPVRDYCFIDDVADAIVSACTFHDGSYTVCNLGTGRGTSVLELARAALIVAGRDIPVVGGTPGRRPLASEIYELIADTTQARSLLGWTARTSLSHGLKKVMDCS